MFFRICKKDRQEKKTHHHWGKLFFGLVLFPAALYSLWRYDQKHPLMDGDASMEAEDTDWENACADKQAYDGQASSEDTDAGHFSSEQWTHSGETVFSSMKEDQTPHADDAERFIGNSSTKKFHLTQCMAVDKIGETEKTVFHSAEEALAAGFVPCKRCNPTM